MPGLRAIVLLRVDRRAPWSRIDIARFIAVTCHATKVRHAQQDCRFAVVHPCGTGAAQPAEPPRPAGRDHRTRDRRGDPRDAAGRPAGPGGRAEDRRPQPPGRRQHFAAGRARLPPRRGPQPAPDLEPGLRHARDFGALPGHPDGDDPDRARRRVYAAGGGSSGGRADLRGPVSVGTHGALHALPVHAGPVARHRGAVLGCADRPVRPRDVAAVPPGSRKPTRRPRPGDGVPAPQHGCAGPRGRRGVPARSGVPATCPRWYRRCSTASKRGTRD